MTIAYKFIDHVGENIPDIKDLVSKYLKYEYIMTSQQVSPQKEAKDYDSNAESQFLFEVDDPLIRDDERVIFSVEKEGVYITALFSFDKGSEDFDCREQHFMTHENCLAYLAQLPKTWHHFITDEED